MQRYRVWRKTGATPTAVMVGEVVAKDFNAALEMVKELYGPGSYRIDDCGNVAVEVEI